MAGSLTIDSMPILGERYFTRQRASLVDRNIYERGADSVPYTTKSVRFRGVTSIGATVRVYVNDQLVATVGTDSFGGFVFSVSLPKGRTKVHAQRVSDLSIIGEAIHVNCHTINTFLQAYATEFASIRDDLDRLQQEKFIDDRDDWDGNPLQISSEALRNSFGQFVSGRRRQGQGRTTYRDFLKRQFLAYYYATTVRALNELSLAYLGTYPQFRFLKDTFFARMFSASPTTVPHGFKPRTKMGIGNLLTVEWDAFEVWMYRRWYRVEAGSRLLDADSKYWIYLDGTEDGLNRLELLFMKINIPQIDFPLREIKTTSGLTIVPQSDIRVDTTGVRTGVPGTLYIQVKRIPIAGIAIIGSVYGDMSSVVSFVQGTGWVSLGVQKTPAQIGHLSVVVEYRSEPRILSRVTTTDHITAIEYVGRMRLRTGADGSTNGMWIFESQSRANEFIVVFPNYYLLTASEKEDFDRIAAEVIPAHKLLVVGDNIIAPSEQFPFPVSAEVGATTRLRITPLEDVSAELGSTSRMFGTDTASIPTMVGELGATSRERAIYDFDTVPEWLNAVTQVSAANRDTVRAAIKYGNGTIYALVNSRYLHVENGIANGFFAEVDEAGAAVTVDSGDIEFHAHIGSNTLCMSYFKTGNGLFARIRNDSGTVETELEDAAGANVPKATGRKGVAMASTDSFVVAFAGTPGAEEELLYRVWTAISQWAAAAVNLSNPGGTGTSTFGDTLVQETATSGLYGFLCVWRGDTPGQEDSLYYRTSAGSWELVYDRATAGRVVKHIDLVQDRSDPDKAYAVFVDEDTTTNSEVRFIARDGTWGTSVLLSSTNQGANSPSIAVDEKGNIFVTYVEYDSATSQKSVWLRVRRSGQSVFDAPVLVTPSITSVLVTDTYPKSTHLAKKARTISYENIPILWGDKFGGGGTDNAVYYRIGIRGV